jgi:mono/diheme cytochrome c family protein
MLRNHPTFHRHLQTAAIVLLGLLLYVGLQLWAGGKPVHALPEYAARTGQPCATCHVSAGGGGPLTLRGMLWAAQGREDDIPELPSPLLAPGVSNPVELYDIACAGCHGSQGEGLFGIGLAERGISEAAARTFIENGIPELGMPAFAEQLTPEQINVLAELVAQMGEGNIPPAEYSLPAPQINCLPQAPSICYGSESQ